VRERKYLLLPKVPENRNLGYFECIFILTGRWGVVVCVHTDWEVPVEYSRNDKMALVY
jgi:hypothetical protein